MRTTLLVARSGADPAWPIGFRQGVSGAKTGRGLAGTWGDQNGEHRFHRFRRFTQKTSNCSFRGISEIWEIRVRRSLLRGEARRARLRRYCFAAPGFEKSTDGAVRAPGVVTSKYSRGLAPVTFAVNDCGSVRMYVLYVWTAPL